MIEINLVPDVKRELLKAQKVRSSVISMAIIVSIAAVSVVVLLAFWVFAVQTVRSISADGTIKSEDKKLHEVKDLSHALTIQNQLSQLTKLHDSKHLTSHVFDVLSTINPPEPNNIGINTLKLDTTNNTITVEAQAANGYPALEVFRKTIKATTFQYTEGGTAQSVPLASDISDSNRSYGEDASGQKVLRFTLSFTYPEQLLQPYLTNTAIVAPNKTNVTDSYLGVPQSLFTEKAADVKEEN